MKMLPQVVDDARAAVARGVSVVCATCSHWRRARAAGAPGDGCLAPGRCASPLGGFSFPLYDGPIPVEAWVRFCFVCGASATARVRVHGDSTDFGLCPAHADMALAVAPAAPAPDGAPLPELWIAVGYGPFKARSTILARPRKQTFGEFFVEVERFFARREGRPDPFTGD